MTPYIALGKRLEQAGCQVRIAAPHSFAPLVESNRLSFFGFTGNPSDLLVEQGNQTALTLGRNPIRSLQATRQFIRKARPLYREMLHSAAEACRGSDLLLHGLPTIWGAHIAEGLRIPSIRAVTQPLYPTREFPSVLFPFRFSFGGLGNRLTHWLVMQFIWLAWRREITGSRKADFGLPPAKWLDPSLQTDSNQPPVLNGFSEKIVPRPQDWDEKQILTGYWNMPPHEWNPPEDLLKFIKESQNCIAIGFGSPGIRGFSHLLKILEDALAETNAQAVLTIPARWHSEIKTKDIFPIEYVPHNWLYSRVHCAIHHGGAGTSSASFHAGIPFITTPLAIDQFFWGERAFKLGVSPAPIPQRRLTSNDLANAIRQVMGSNNMHTKAKALSVELSHEDGVEAAVNVIRQYL